MAHARLVETGPATAPAARAEAIDLARRLPGLIVAAKQTAASVMHGVHGRRRAGIGETFWQFRPFAHGESTQRIDWRRSARDDHTYVRDREWEAAHTVWIWADLSPSMMYKSTFASVSKESRALVIMLALAEILARSGERIGCPGVMEPIAARNAAERLATALMHNAATGGLPDTSMIRGNSDVVLIGDFLDPVEDVMERLGPLARRGLAGHVVEIADPAEEIFPFVGRTEFTDPESGQKLTAGRAETLKDDYARAYVARRETLADNLRHLGWSFVTHHTDRLASEALVAVHAYLSGMPTLKTGGRGR